MSNQQRASTRVQWVHRLLSLLTADVVRRDRFGRVEWCVRICGTDNSAEARQHARDFRAGKPLPFWIRAFGEITDQPYREPHEGDTL